MAKTKSPRKQRKRRLDAPMHRRQKMLCAPLKKDLRGDLGRRNLPLRSGDTVVVTRGDFKGKESKVRDVNLKKLKVTLEDVKREKVDGTEIRPPIDPSNLMIVEPDLSDPRREAIVERAGGEAAEEFKKGPEEEEAEEETEEKEAKEEGEKEEKEKKGFKCEICGKVYDSKRGLSIHKGKSHPEYTK